MALDVKKELEVIRKTMATKEDLKAFATKKELRREIDNLARVTAEGFAATATKTELRTLKNEMKAGFGLIMENLVPMRRDYEALKDELVPQVANLDARLTKVERKVGI